MRGLMRVRVGYEWRRSALSRMAAIVGMLAAFVLAPRIAVGQVQATIAGSVKDGSGAVLPGVTVEVASPVLIEKTRTAVTDGTGQYRIVDLRPGTYSVTFTPAGFHDRRARGHRADRILHGNG